MTISAPMTVASSSTSLTGTTVTSITFNFAAPFPADLYLNTLILKLTTTQTDDVTGRATAFPSSPPHPQTCQLRLNQSKFTEVLGCLPGTGLLLQLVYDPASGVASVSNLLTGAIQPLLLANVRHISKSTDGINAGISALNETARDLLQAVKHLTHTIERKRLIVDSDLAPVMDSDSPPALDSDPPPRHEHENEGGRARI